MAIYSGTTSDAVLNGYLSLIRTADHGKEARAPMSNAVNRCYYFASQRAGGPRNGVTQASIDEHRSRITTAVYGEEVRDALQTGLVLCYKARGINVSQTEQTYLRALIDAQTGDDLKNNILRSIVKCYQDIMA